MKYWNSLPNLRPQIDSRVKLVATGEKCSLFAIDTLTGLTLGGITADQPLTRAYQVLRGSEIVVRCKFHVSYYTAW